MLTLRSSTSSRLTPYFPSTGCRASRIRLVDFAVMRMVFLREEISRLWMGEKKLSGGKHRQAGAEPGVWDCLETVGCGSQCMAGHDVDQTCEQQH